MKTTVTPYKRKISLSPICDFNDEASGENGGYRYADEMQNFRVERGKLVTGEGVKFLGSEFVTPNSVAERVYFYRRFDPVIGNDDRVVVYCLDKKLYECPVGGGTFTEIPNVTLAEPPEAECYNFNGTDVIIFSKSGGGIYIYDGTTTTAVNDAPIITSMCFHNERLFVTTGGADNALWFSDDFDPTNWNVSLTEAGFIDLNDFRGDMKRVVSFGDYLYVFRTFGITRITAYSDQRLFSAANVFQSSGKIYEKSITVCGNCILFMASDGLYRFDGVSATKISGKLSNYLVPEFDEVKGQYYNGYAYILVLTKSGDTSLRQVLRIDPKTLDASFMTVALKDLTLISSEKKYALLGVAYGYSEICEVCPECKFLGNNPKILWRNKESDFDIPSVKTLTKVTLYVDKPIKLRAIADGVKHEYALEGSTLPTVVKPNIRGVKFCLEVEGTSDGTTVSEPTIETEYYL